MCAAAAGRNLRPTNLPPHCFPAWVCRAAGATVLSFTDTSVSLTLAPPDTTTLFDKLSVAVCEAGGEKTCKNAVECTPAEANTPCTVTVTGLTAATAYTATGSALEGTVSSVAGTAASFTTRYS